MGFRYFGVFCPSREAQTVLNRWIVDVFGADRIQSLMADREFVGQKWLCFLYDQGIPFYIRMKKNRLVEWGEEDKPLVFFLQHLKTGERRLLYKEIKVMKLSLVGTRSQARELVLIMTNQLHHKQPTSSQRSQYFKNLCKKVDNRMLFKNTKSNGFNLESTHVTYPDKLEKLMGVIAVATAICIRAGQWQEKIKPTIYKKTVKAPLYSTFRRGFDVLRRWLTNLKNILILLYTPNPLENKEFSKNVG
jgi:hypothetical protein